GDTGPFDSRMVFGDFDGDGDVDILYQNGNAPGVGIGYKQNLGNGTFRDFADARAAGTPFAGFDFTNQQISSSFLFAVDLNNDGRVDIVDRSNNAFQYWQQQSNGTFVKILPDPIGHTGPFDSRMVFGDFDGDGDVDILYQNGNVAGVGIGYKQNLGNGTFQDFADARAAGTPFAGFDFTNQQISSSFLFAVDIDHDGDVDLVDRSNGATQVWIQGSDTGGDGSPPTLVATNPTDNATGISRTASIVLTFDEAVFAGSGNIRIVRIADRSVVETIAVSGGAVSIAGSTVTIAHGALAANTGYAIQIDQGAFVDSDGIVYAGIRGTDFTTLNFTTVATQPPVLTATSGSTAASEQIAVPIDPGIIVTDPDSTTLASATVAITGNFRSGQDVLAFANMSTAIYGNVVGTYNGATGVLTLTSSGATATLAQFQAVLRSVTYTDTSDTPDTSPRTITFTANDGSGASTAVSKSVTVAAVNDAPTATGLSNTLGLAEDTIARLFTTPPTIADVDSATVTATLTLADPAAGTLLGATPGAAGVYIITGSPASVAAALSGVVFAPAANYNGLTSVAVAISDGQNGPQGTNPTGTVSITVAPVNDAPTATGLTQALIVAEDSVAPLFTGALTIADVDSAVVTATLTLADPAAGRLINATPGAAGVYTVTGSPAAVATALKSVVFAPATNYNGLTSVAVAISDGQNGPQGINPTGTVSITVAPVNDAPTATGLTQVLGLAEDAAATKLFTVAPTIADVDSTFVFATLTLADPAAGSLNAPGLPPGTGGVYNLFGSVAQVNAQLAAITFTPAANYHGSTSIAVAINDGQNGPQGSNPTGTVSITVAPVADTPSVTAASTGEDAQTTAGLVIARNAVDGSEVAWFKITNIQHGTLYLADGTTPVSAGTFITDAQASAGLKFTPEPNFNGTGSFDVQASTSNADAGLGGGIAKASINVAPVNDAPTATGLTQALSLAEDAAATKLFTVAPTIADVDGNFVFATLTLADPAAGSLTGPGLTGGPGGVYNLFGSLGQVSASLAAIAFAPAANYHGTTSIAVVVDDGQNGPQGVNPAGTVSITVTPVNDAPTATGLTQALGLAEDAVATKLFTTAPTVADIDSATVTATLTLADPATGSLAGAGPGVGGVYTISGSPAAVAALLAAVTFTPAANYHGTTSVAVAIDDGLSGPQGVNPTGTVAITVASVNDAPVAAAEAYQTDRNTALTVPAATGLLANDTDVDGDTLSAVLVTGPAHGILTVNADGSFVYTPAAGYVGADSFTYRASDGLASSNAVTVDITVGTPVPTGLALAAGDDTGISGSDKLTNKASMTVTGSGQAGAAVSIFDDANNNGVRDGAEAVVGTANVGAGGTFSAAVTLSGDGVHHLVATQTSGVGTSLGSAALDVTLDTTAPTAAATADAASAAAASTTFTLRFSEAVQRLDLSDLALTATGSAAGTIAGISGSGGDYVVTVNGIVGTGTLAVALSGTSDVIDAAGNPATLTGSTAHAVDRVAPDAPAITGFTPDTGTAGDGITASRSPTLSGTAEAGATVTVLDAGVRLGETVASADGRWSFTPGTLADGAHSLTATATDAAGNTGAASAALALTIDSIAPAVPRIALASDTGTAGDGITSNPALVYTVDAGTSLLYAIDGGAFGTAAPAFRTDGTQDGRHSVQVRATDVAGNVTDSDTFSFVLDTTADAGSDPTGAGGQNDDGVRATLVVDGTSNGLLDRYEAGRVSFAVSGLDADAQAVASFTDGSHSATATVAADGRFTVDLSAFKGTVTSAL
ncbi:beta strand repeat-containing protein, partial [Methylobacterium sp. CG09_land_8_20_14_0_10_71_15]|uniref:beta strand repeat-containing protein n=1 Tax=Methylobacterium sp. CG09_land_8_20_14_0_10_71_15 TaxID=1975532 RepID=UPI00257F1536